MKQDCPHYADDKPVLSICALWFGRKELKASQLCTRCVPKPPVTRFCHVLTEMYNWERKIKMFQASFLGVISLFASLMASQMLLQPGPLWRHCILEM